MTELHDPPPGRAGSALEQAPPRRPPSGSVAALTWIGLLSALGVAGTFIVA